MEYNIKFNPIVNTAWLTSSDKSYVIVINRGYLALDSMAIDFIQQNKIDAVIKSFSNKADIRILNNFNIIFGNASKQYLDMEALYDKGMLFTIPIDRLNKILSILEPYSDDLYGQDFNNEYPEWIDLLLKLG